MNYKMPFLMFSLSLDKLKIMNMKLFSIFLFLSLFFTSCANNANEKEDIKKLLKTGEWKLVSSDKKFNHFQSGLKFSPDKQVFFLDSQGYVIPPHHKQVYEVSGDTLMIIDYKYEPQILYERGTFILLIKELTEEEFVGELIHPDKGNVLKFKQLH